MEDLIPKLIALAALILMSAYFSATETAFSSVNKIRLKNMASEGNKKAKKLLNKNDITITAIPDGVSVIVQK